MPMIKVSSGLEIKYIIPSSPDPATLSIDTTRPTVILLHPWFFDSHFFAPQYRDSRLAKAYNLVAIDHHYHGHTKAPLDDKPYDWQKVAKDILSVMDAMKIKEAHILGNSLGAHIAMFMAMRAPSRVQSLMLIAQHAPVENEENLEQFRFLRDSCYAKADDGSDKLATDVVNGLHWMYFGGDPSAQSLIDEWVASSKFRPSNAKLITKLFSGILDRKPFDTAACDAITCPILVVHGANDATSHPLVAHDSYHIFRNTQREIHVIDGAPHFLSYTHYSTVNKLLADFLDRVTGVDSKAAALAPRKLSNGATGLVVSDKKSLGAFFRIRRMSIRA